MTGPLLVHQHLIVRAEVSEPFTDCKKAGQWLTELVGKIGMKILSGPHVEYSEKTGNRGLTGFVIIETSHIAIHLWDEVQPALAQLDVYTCSNLELPVVFDHFSVLCPVRVEHKFLDRDRGLTLVQGDPL